MELRRKQVGYFVLIVVLFLLASRTFGQTLESKDLTAEVQKALASITAQDLHAHLRFLASDLLEGRGTPGRGVDIAAVYLAANLERIGLEPVGSDGDFFQPYTVHQFDPTPQNTEVCIIFGEEKISLTSEECLPRIG